MQEERDKMHKLEKVPYYSQFRDVRNPEWRNRACTITCLKMAMEYATKNRMPSIDDLYAEALKIQNFLVSAKKITPEAVSKGLLHDAVVNVAHNHLVPAHKEEFRSMIINLNAIDGVDPGSPNPEESRMLDYGIKMICQRIADDSPVIVSVKRGFASNGTYHSVLLTGYLGDAGFYYSDPDNENDPGGEKSDLFVSLSCFRLGWRGLAIFVDAIPK